MYNWLINRIGQSQNMVNKEDQKDTWTTDYSIGRILPWEISIRSPHIFGKLLTTVWIHSKAKEWKTTWCRRLLFTLRLKGLDFIYDHISGQSLFFRSVINIVESELLGRKNFNNYIGKFFPETLLSKTKKNKPKL